MAKIVGIDQALNDITVDVKSSFLRKLGIQKGDRKTINDAELEKILPVIESLQTRAGGTVRNVIRNLASFGEDTGLIAAIGNDARGKEFRESLNGIKDLTVQYPGKTGVVIAYLTEEKERSFQTYLGVSSQLSKTSIEKRIKEGEFEDTKVLVMSGFLFEKITAPLYSMACYALDYANKNGIKVALSLGAIGFLERNSKNIMRILNKYEVGLVSLNEQEINTLTGKKDYRDSAVKIMPYCDVLTITRGHNGIFLKTKDVETGIGLSEKDKVAIKSKNGAGDAAFSTVIYEYANYPFNVSIVGRAANKIAGKVICSDSSSIDKKIDYSKIRDEAKKEFYGIK